MLSSVVLLGRNALGNGEKISIMACAELLETDL